VLAERWCFDSQERSLEHHVLKWHDALSEIQEKHEV
jgi:hypothetical protein